jgi:hypothetical protein
MTSIDRSNGVEAMPVRRVLTAKKTVTLIVCVGVPQLGLQLVQHHGSGQDMMSMAMLSTLLATVLALALVAVWRMYEDKRRRAEHFQNRAEMAFITARGFAFSHAFVLSNELEELIRDLLPDAQEAEQYHSGLARGIAEARDPATYRRARREAADGTRFYIAGDSLSNQLVRATPMTSIVESEGEGK